MLPSPSRLRFERNKAGPVQMGVQPDLLQRLILVAANESDSHQKKLALLMDEMTIKGKQL